jgi:DNA-binding beta-propeller fold protein YncE
MRYSIVLLAALGLSATPASALPTTGHYIYAVQDSGAVNIYNIDANHNFVRSIATGIPANVVRSVVVSKPLQTMFICYGANGASGAGHIVSLNLVSEKVNWNKTYAGADRCDITPDGKTLYVPTGEANMNIPYIDVVNAQTGAQITTIPTALKTHNAKVGPSGKFVYVENKSVDYIQVISTATNKVVGEINLGTGNISQPFVVNGAETLLLNNLNLTVGWQEHKLLNGVQQSSTTVTTGGGHHGIGLRPDEKELWVSGDGNNLNKEAIFDMTVSPPKLKRYLNMPWADRPQWVTFSIDGRFAYVSGSVIATNVTPVFSTSSYTQIANVGISEALLEVDVANGAVSAVGNQYGIGRVP